ncbi:MAG: hypothetical protein LBL91_03010 [Lachnospiraceae bacterium]|jgi:hypothetical protein|nr:hypothetical protein [Lachnospiraceae bacterium]
MEYLKKFKITDKQIKYLKDKYNKSIISFISENEIFVTETIEYLYSENIDCIFLLLDNNIRIFLETKIALKKKIEELKMKNYSIKAIIASLALGN